VQEFTAEVAPRRNLKAAVQVSEEEYKQLSKSEKKKVIKERAKWDQDWVPKDKEDEIEVEKLDDFERAAMQASYPANLFSES